MRIIVIILICLSSCSKNRSHIKHKYYSSIENANEEIKTLAEDQNQYLFDSWGNGSVIIDYNCTEYYPTSNDIENCTKSIESKGVWIASSQFKNNILLIDLGQIYSYEKIIIELRENRFSCELNVWNKYDKIYKINERDSLQKEVFIKHDNFNIELSKESNFEIGETVYGIIELKTKAYFEFEKGIKKKRKHIKAIFKCKIKEPITPWHEEKYFNK